MLLHKTALHKKICLFLHSKFLQPESWLFLKVDFLYSVVFRYPNEPLSKISTSNINLSFTAFGEITKLFFTIFEGRKIWPLGTFFFICDPVLGPRWAIYISTPFRRKSQTKARQPVLILLPFFHINMRHEQIKSYTNKKLCVRTNLFNKIITVSKICKK